jgi:hypothetical protein
VRVEEVEVRSTPHLGDPPWWHAGARAGRGGAGRVLGAGWLRDPGFRG